MTGTAVLPDWLAPVADDPAYGWAVSAWAKAAEVPDAWFDADKAQRIVAAWPDLFCLTDDRFSGVPFKLTVWEEIIVRLLVGWKRPVQLLDPKTHQPVTVYVRLYRRLLLWIARKNGKSEFLAALALLFYVFDAVDGGQGFCFARDEKQARIPFDKMKKMIGHSRMMSEAVQMHRNSLYLKHAASVFELLSGAEQGKHGKSPTVILGDEIHEWRSREVENTLRQGTGARLQPIEIYGSTAGLRSNPTGVEIWEETQGIIDGRLDDPTTLAVVFAAPQDADWQDESVWPLANPTLGLSPTLDFLRQECRKAQGNPRAEAQFRRYHLNQWIDSEVRWLNMDRWRDCTGDIAWQDMRSAMRGRRCAGALDVSATQDITALVLAFEATADDPVIRLLPRFWLPAECMEDRIRHDRAPYDRFMAAGALETTPGNYVDQNYVKQAILGAKQEFDLGLIAFDPWNAAKLAGDLQAEGLDEDELVAFRQGIHSFAEPSRHFERLICAGQLAHGGHPVLGWMAGHTILRFDENMNFMPTKKRSPAKIDGIIASVMALGVLLGRQEDDGLDQYLASQKAAA
jgi:phage terminase large subunit-like protein